MRRFITRLAVVALGVAGLGVLGAGAAQATYVCDSAHPINGTTINDNVLVPSGQFCYITSSTINGSITVQPEGNLDVRNSTIKGSITATNPFGFGLTNTTVYGPVTVNGTSSTDGGGEFICGSTFYSSVSITKSVSTGTSDFWQIGQFNFCPANNFKGNFSYTNNAKRLVFQGNNVGGSVTATDNVGGGGDVSFNTIKGSLTLQRNNPCFVNYNNTVSGASNVFSCPTT